MKVNLTVTCDCNRDNKQLIKIRQSHVNAAPQIWIECDCGKEYYLGDDEDVVGKSSIHKKLTKVSEESGFACTKELKEQSEKIYKLLKG
ncbi:hypothetical protein WKH57_01185 [Niallia taxi]|uniref:hypothetical protein n=1 Tax=Niallia taxi TaxID=2499688 RepID=UPI00317C39E0